GFQRALIPHAVDSAIGFNLSMMYGQYFRYRQVDALLHLLLASQLLVQLAVLLVGASGGFHHFRTNEALRRDHIAQVERERLLQHMALALAILLGDRHKLLVERRINLGRELLGLGSCHGFNLPLKREDTPAYKLNQY